MRLNLDSLRSEIQEHLESRGIVVFHAYPRSAESASAVQWETGSYPDYRMFVAAAEAAGVRLMTLYAHQFTDDMIDDALARLEETGLARDEQRALDMRLREMRGYAGFTCQIELAFDLAPRVYVFDLRTEWFDDLNDILDRIDEAYEDEEDDAGGPLGSGGGYYSNN